MIYCVVILCNGRIFKHPYCTYLKGLIFLLKMMMVMTMLCLPRKVKSFIVPPIYLHIYISRISSFAYLLIHTLIMYQYYPFYLYDSIYSRIYPSLNLYLSIRRCLTPKCKNLSLRAAWKFTINLQPWPS